MNDRVGLRATVALTVLATESMRGNCSDFLSERNLRLHGEEDARHDRSRTGRARRLPPHLAACRATLSPGRSRQHSASRTRWMSE